MMRFVVTAMIGLIASSGAYAHDLIVEVHHFGGKLVVSVQSDDGTPIKDATVAFPIDQRGMTDENGKVTFEIPVVGIGFRLTVDAGNGHVAIMEIKLPPKPWAEGQLFSEPAPQPFLSRMRAIIIGLLVIVLVMFVAMKSMNRRQRQPS